MTKSAEIDQLGPSIREQTFGLQKRFLAWWGCCRDRAFFSGQADIVSPWSSHVFPCSPTNLKDLADCRRGAPLFAMEGEIDPINLIMEHKEAWLTDFESEKKRILDAIGQYCSAIEHVGSTSITGLAAKPIIDIMVSTADQGEWPSIVANMRLAGYYYWAEDNFSYERLFFIRFDAAAEKRIVHVHVAEATSAFWRSLIAFRNILRSQPQLAKEYEALKRHLSASFPNDRNRYTEGKTAFIRATVAAHGDGLHGKDIGLG